MRAARLLPLLLLAAVSCGTDPVQPEPEPETNPCLTQMSQEQQAMAPCPVVTGGDNPASPPPTDREPVVPPGPWRP